MKLATEQNVNHELNCTYFEVEAPPKKLKKQSTLVYSTNGLTNFSESLPVSGIDEKKRDKILHQSTRTHKNLPLGRGLTYQSCNRNRRYAPEYWAELDPRPLRAKECAKDRGTVSWSHNGACGFLWCGGKSHRMCLTFSFATPVEKPFESSNTDMTGMGCSGVL